MAPWKKLLSKSADLGKYEKEEKQKYKQYVKIEKQSAQLRSKPESEVYEDLFLLRAKSLRRSSKKRKAPPPRTTENAYEIIEAPPSNNVVVINDDLRHRFAGYELPKTQENLYVVVQPREAEVAKPTRPRWKKPLPTPPQSLTSPPQEISSPKPKPKEALRVHPEDEQDTSMSEVFYDCEDYSSPNEDLKESRHPNHPETNLTRTSTEPESSYDVEYAEYDTYADYSYESQKVYNRYAGEEFGPEDESRWQPSNIRFCEMSGDEDEQQIYGPFGTFEVASYEDALNSRIQMVVEGERYSVMLSLEDQRNAEAADTVDGVDMEKVFEFTGGGAYLDPYEDSFGAVGAFETEGEDEEEEVLVEAKNIALIDNLEDPKRGFADRHLKGSAPSDLYEEDTQGAKKVGRPTPSNHLEIPTHKIVGGPTHSNLREEIHEEPKGAESDARHLEVPTYKIVDGPTPSKLHEEIHEEPKRAENVALHLEVPTHQTVGGPTPSNLREEVHEEPKRARNVAPPLKVPNPSSLLPQKGYEEVQKAEPLDNNEAITRKEGEVDRAEEKESPTLPQVPPPVEKGLQEDVKETPQAEAETRKTPHLSSSSFRLIDNYSAFLKDPMSMMTPRLGSSSRTKPHETTERKEDGKAYESQQFHRSAPKEESSPGLKESLDPKVTPRSSLRSSSKLLQDDLKPNGTTQLKGNENLQLNRSAPKEESPPGLKKSLDPKVTPRSSLRSSSKLLQDDPKPNGTTQLKGNENLQLNRSAPKEESPPGLKKTLDPKVTPRSSLRSSSKLLQDDLKPNGTTQLKGNENLQLNRSPPKEESPPGLKKSLDPKVTPRSSLRSSSKLLQDDLKPNGTTQLKGNENLQLNRSTPEEESPPNHPTPQLRLRSSTKIKRDDPKPDETTQHEEDDLAYENFQFNHRSTRKEESPPHLEKSPQGTPGYHKNPVAQPRFNLSNIKWSRPPPRQTKNDFEPPKSNEEKEKLDGKALHQTQNYFEPPKYKEERGNSKPDGKTLCQPQNDFEPPKNKEEGGNSKLDGKTLCQPQNDFEPPKNKEEGGNSKVDGKALCQPQNDIEPPKNKKEGGNSKLDGKAVCQPQNDFEPPKNKEEAGNSKLDAKVLCQPQSDFEPPKDEEEKTNSELDGEARPQNAISDLFNGLPVESEELERNIHKGSSWDHELFNGLPVTKREILGDKSRLNDEGNLKINWATKPKMSPSDGSTFTYFGTSKGEEDRVAQNAKPIEGTFAFFNNAKGEGVVQSERESKPLIPPIYGDTSILFNHVKEEETPWNARPKLASFNTFVPFSRTPEEEFANPKKQEQSRENPKPNLPKASEDVQNEPDDHAHVNFNRDSKTPAYVNFNMKNPWETRPKNLEQNEQRSVGVPNSNSDDITGVPHESISSNEFQFETKSITPEKLGQNSPSSPTVRNKDTFPPLTEKSGPKELGDDISKLDSIRFRDPVGEENAPWGSNPSVEAGTLKPDPGDFIVGLERSHSLKQKTWHANLLEKYEGPSLNRAPSINDKDARHQATKEGETNPPNSTIEQTIVDDRVEKVGTQDEANILEGSYRILRGFDVAKEEGIVYHNVQTTPDPPRRPSKRTKIPKKVSFRISDVPDGSPPNVYVPAHSPPTEKTGLIKKSARLEAITRKLEKTPILQHSTSLTEAEKPKPNFSTFPRSTSHVQSLPKRSDLERLQQVLTGISDLGSIQEQVSAMEGVSNKVKERVGKFDRSAAENEYSELLQIMFRSVRIATVLECGFDPDLLDRQQTLLDEIRSSIATLNSK